MKFKVGDRVEHEIYGKGTVIGVSDMDTPLVEFDVCQHGFHDGGFGETNGIRGKDGHCWFTDSIKPIENQAIVIYPKGLETIALLKEGKKIIKQASAKCNPTDEFDFEIGAKLAFDRLLGRGRRLDLKTTNPSFDWEAFKQGKFAVHCDTEEKAKAFLKECDNWGIRWENINEKASEFCPRQATYFEYKTGFGGLLWGSKNYFERNGYAVTEYAPTIREVKRPAKVGEWVKIIDAKPSVTTTMEYKNGDILQITHLDGSYRHYGKNSTDYLYDEEYVVLENYQPEETTKTLADYTDKELINELSRRWEDKQ